MPADAGLRPGMSAEVKILVKTIADAITVPVQAVAEFDGKHICYVLGSAGLERREVQIGDSNQQLIQILEGVAEGERVALDARVRAASELKKLDESDPGRRNGKDNQETSSAKSSSK